MLYIVFAKSAESFCENLTILYLVQRVKKELRAKAITRVNPENIVNDVWVSNLKKLYNCLSKGIWLILFWSEASLINGIINDNEIISKNDTNIIWNWIK